MTGQRLYKSVTERRRDYLVHLDFKDEQVIHRQNRRYVKKTAEMMGHYIGSIRHFLGIPTELTPADYVKYVVEPIYLAGGMGNGLYDSWRQRAKRIRSLGADPRVKAFLAGGNEMITKKGDQI